MSRPDVAALFVEAEGPYANLPDVLVWDVERDARKYRGPFPVVAHPPCKRWGRYWSGGPSAKQRQQLGSDDGCFAHALWSVRTFRGVIEHPKDSHAWAWFGLPEAPRLGFGWGNPDRYGGRSCTVVQGRYGHAARKATWLYAVLAVFPALDWGDMKGVRLEDGFHSSEERQAARAAGVKPVKRISKEQRLHTPEPFRDALLSMARSGGAS